MFLRTVETAFARYQAKGEAAALAIVFDRTAPELLRLARHLAGDAALAEDLVQATFLTAIESAQSHVYGRPLLPWLCGILANHARSTRRQQRRVPDPSRLRGDVVHDAANEVEQRALQAGVGQAIGKLPEIYRPVLRLWLEHGLEAHEIAATLERPAGTVRAQVTRGLDLLRRALPASLAGASAIAIGTGRGLAAVRADVLGTCAATSTTLASTLAIGGLLVLHHKLLVGGIAATLALLLWFAWSPPPTAPSGPTGGARPAVVAATGATTSPIPAAPEARGLANQRDAAPVPAAEPGTPDAPAVATELLVKLRDARDGQLLEGYGVALRRASDLQNFGVQPTFVASDERGEVLFTDIEPGHWLLDIDRRGPAMGTTVLENQHNEQVVELEPSGVIKGRVVGPDEQPVPGATILGHGNRLAAPVLVTTDRHGTFELRHLGQLELQAKKSGFTPSSSQPVPTTANVQVDVTLRLGVANRRLAGTVRTHAGEPVAAAAIAIMPSAARHAHPWDRGGPQHRAIWLRADQQGRFETSEVGADRYLVVAVPTEQETPPTLGEADTTHSDGFVDLRCPEPTIIEGRITENGVPARSVTVVAFAEQPTEDIGYLLNLVGLRTADVDADGAFRICGLVPGLISLRAVRNIQVIAETRRELSAGATLRWHADPGATEKLRIHVRAPLPLPQHLMALIYTRVDGAAPTMVPIDQTGEVEVDLHRDGPIDITLAVYRNGINVAYLARYGDVPASQPELNVELRREQLPIATLHGRCVTAQQAPVSGMVVRVRRIDDPALVVIFEAATQSDGTFSLGPVTAGEYALETGLLGSPQRLRSVAATAAGDEHLGDLVVSK